MILNFGQVSARQGEGRQGHRFILQTQHDKEGRLLLKKWVSSVIYVNGSQSNSCIVPLAQCSSFRGPLDSKAICQWAWSIGWLLCTGTHFSARLLWSFHNSIDHWKRPLSLFMPKMTFDIFVQVQGCSACFTMVAATCCWGSSILVKVHPPKGGIFQGGWTHPQSIKAKWQWQCHLQPFTSGMERKLKIKRCQEEIRKRFAVSCTNSPRIKFISCAKKGTAMKRIIVVIIISPEVLGHFFRTHDDHVYAIRKSRQRMGPG